MNMEELAERLKEKINVHVITLDEVEEYILNRKIAQLQGLFSDERHKEQVYKLFYMYDKKGRRQIGDEKIVFRNHEYLVVRATKGWREPSKAAKKYYDASAGYYHSAWVFGMSDGKPWIHRLDWDSNFENDSFEWTREYILSKMRFSASVDEVVSFDKGQAIRLQGDLTVQKTRTLQEYKDSEKYKWISGARYRFDDEFRKVAIEKNKDEIDRKTAEIDADAKKVDGIDKKSLRELKKKYGITERTHIDRCIMRKSYGIENEVVQREKDAHGFGMLIENRIKDTEKEFEAEFISRQTRQVNVRFGNHLIIVERGIMTRDEVIVFEDSQCFIIHDEHENRIVTLDAGVYSFGLLARHITDRR